MTISWKDAAATVLVGIAGVITYAKLKGFDWPLIGSWRGATLALLIVGLGSCIIIGSGGEPEKNAWTTIASILGGLAGILVLSGLVLGNRVIFYVLAIDIFVLWLITTLHHLLETKA